MWQAVTARPSPSTPIVALPSAAPPRSLRALVEVRQRARRRLAPALLVGVTGALTLFAGLAPAKATGLLYLSPTSATTALTGRVALVELGVLMVITARLLARGSRGAWAVSVLSAAGVLGTELVRGRLSLAAPVAAVALVGLLLTRQAFRLRFGAGRSPGRLLVPLILLLALLSFAVLTYAELDVLRSQSLRHRLSLVARSAVAAPGGINSEQSVVEAYVLALRIGLAGVLGSLVWALRRQWGQTLSADVDQARRLAETHGVASAAPLLSLPDNTRLPLQGGRALAGMAVRNGVALSLGAPVAPAGLRGPALAEFVAYCESSGWIPALLALDAPQLRQAEDNGFVGLKIGEEAFLDVATFSTTGSRRANIRHSVTRARKDGVVVLRYDAHTRTPARDRQLAELSADWLAGKGGPELGFTLGRFDLARLADQEVYVALTSVGAPDEQVAGFVTWLPYRDGDAAVLDLMRRSPTSPPGVMETLVVDSLADFATRGRSRASLGGVPLAATTERTDRTQQVLGWLYEHGASVYAAKGLFRFKDKFDPSWEPMYLAYPRAADAPRIGLAALRAFLPPGAVRELLTSPTRRGS